MRCVTYKCILIFIIIQCVKSQDNNPDQPADDEEEEDNFDVLDLDEIIAERISRFDDPQYQPQYQQIQESQYQAQPLTQPQYYDLDQGESYQYPQEPTYYGPPQTVTQQPESFQYQPQQYGQFPSQQQQVQYVQELLEAEQYGQYQPHTQPQPPQTIPYQPYQAPQPQPQPQSYGPYQHYGPAQQQISQYYYYGPESTDPYGYQPPYGTQTFYDTVQQPITETQVTQPEQYYQHYGPPSYDPYQHIPTYPPGYQTQPMEHYEPQPQTQPQTIEEEDEDFYVTEHDQPYPQQEPQPSEEQSQQPVQPQQPQKPQKQKKKPKKPKRARSPGDEQPRKRGRPRKCRIYNEIKFSKLDSKGDLVEMTVEDYEVTYEDRIKARLKFKANLEQIECDNEIVYVHLSGTSYCSRLKISRYTKIFILDNSDGFTLVRRVEGVWERTDAEIPDYVKLYTQDEEGNEILVTEEHYNIDFTSIASFRYELHPGVKCHKIVIYNMTAWEKTDNDPGYPLVIYVSPKLSVIINFDSYTKMFERKSSRYRFLLSNPTKGRRKYK